MSLYDLMPCAAGVYAITHIASGKKYVGSSINMRKRLRRHLHDLTAGIHHSSHLQNAWRKHGATAFRAATLELWPEIKTLCDRESQWILAFKSADTALGYNICKIGRSCAGTKKTPEQRERIRQRMLGTTMSAYTKAILLAANIGRIQTKEERLKKSLVTRKYGTAAVDSWIGFIANGGTYSQLEHDTGVSRSTLRKRIHPVLGTKWTRTEITQQMRDDFIRRYAAGESVVKIAAHFGCDKKAVSDVVRSSMTAEGTRIRQLKGIEASRLPQESIARISEMVALKMPYRQIGRILGIRHTTVRKYAMKDMHV